MAVRPNFNLIPKANGVGIRFYVEFNGTKERIHLYEKGWSAEDAIAAMMEYKQNSGFVQDREITISGFLNKFYNDYVEQNVAPSTAKRYDEFIALHIGPEIGNIKLQEIKPAQIQGLYTTVIKKKKLSTTTALKIHRLLHLAFKYAISWGYLRYNPCDGVKAPAEAHTEMVIPTDEEMKAILLRAQSDNMSIFMPIYIASTTGMRLGEVLGLQNSSVDMDGKRYIVTQTLKRIGGKLVLGKLKTKSSRRPIPFLAGDDKVLKMYIAYKEQAKLKAKAKWRETDYFLVNKYGEPLAGENTSHWFKKIIRELNLNDKMNYHCLRHYHASWLLRQKVHPKVVSERLGHSNVSITLNRYSHLLPDMQTDIVNSLDSSVFKSGHVSGRKFAVVWGMLTKKTGKMRTVKVKR